MTRNEFSQLLQNYLDDQCSDTEQRLVESWFALLDDEKRWQAIPKEEIKAIEQRLWNRLQQSMHAGEAESIRVAPVKKIFRLPVVGRVAAAVVFMLVIATVVFQVGKTKTSSDAMVAKNWIRKANDTKQPLTVVLKDGSSLELAAGTAIQYPENFAADKRELRIEGTAFFQIKKDTSRPFYVYSQDIMTRVLGTSFWVIYDKVTEQSAVEVVSGKVAVYKQAAVTKAAQTEGVVLKPNEKVIFNKKDEVLITALVDTPVPVVADSLETIPVKTAFVYEETPLADVVRDMEKEYGISIILGEEKLSTLRFTGNISSLDYYTKLKTICKSLGTAYEIKGSRILIQER
ncbi:FecR family protein [Flavitalea antarctica]